MKDSLELLLKDIYALEPSLRERDAEVRVLVEFLLLNKPEVKVSMDFRESLRAKLIATNVTEALPARLVPSPWMSYFVPLGAMAVLLLMLMPGYVGKQTSQDSLEMNSSADVYMAPEAKRSGSGAPEEATMMMMEDVPMPMAEGDSLGISDQVPGVMAVVDFVSLLQPGFVVITSNENVLGSSYLLFAGYNEQIEIPLSRPMKANQTFSATLYLDNGDGVFDLNTDMSIYDANGLGPVSQVFSITQ